jgi:hypothetical protein
MVYIFDCKHSGLKTGTAVVQQLQLCNVFVYSTVIISLHLFNSLQHLSEICEKLKEKMLTGGPGRAIVLFNSHLESTTGLISTTCKDSQVEIASKPVRIAQAMAPLLYFCSGIGLFVMGVCSYIQDPVTANFTKQILFPSINSFALKYLFC